MQAFIPTSLTVGTDPSALLGFRIDTLAWMDRAASAPFWRATATVHFLATPRYESPFVADGHPAADWSAASHRLIEAEGEPGRHSAPNTIGAKLEHDITNPLSAAWTATEVALTCLDRPDGRQIARECLDTILNSIKRCHQVVRDHSQSSRRVANPHTCEDLHERTIE